MALVERVDKRHRRSKTYRHDDAKRTYTTISTLPTLHYQSTLDSGVYDAEVDATPVRVDTVAFDGWRVEVADWHYALGKDLETHGDVDGWVGFGGRQGAHWFKFRLLRLGYLHWPTRAWDDVGGAPDYKRGNLVDETRAITLPESDDTVNVESVATWSRLWVTPGGGELNVAWKVRGDQLKEELVLNQAGREWIAANRPPTTPIAETWFGFVFRLDWNDVPRVYREGLLQDVEGDFADDGEAIVLRDSLDRLLGFMPIDYAYADTGDGKPQTVSLRKRFWKDGDGNHYLLVGARVDQLNTLPAGDLIFDPTVNPQIAADADSATAWTPNNFSYTLSGFFLGDDGPSNYSGARFQLNVPAGASITASYVRLTGHANDTSSNCNVTIAYEDADNIGDYSGDDFTSFQARTRSSTTVAWSNIESFTIDGTHDTPSLNTLISALVSEAYWAANEYCGIFFDNNGSSNNSHREGETYHLDPSEAPILSVTYSTRRIFVTRA